MRLFLILLTSCAVNVDWHANDERHEYERVIKGTAHRGERKDMVECKELGSIHAHGDPDSVIPAIAEEAAKRGGTHYVVDADDTEKDVVTTHNRYQSRSSVVDGERVAQAIVYRCAP